MNCVFEYTLKKIMIFKEIKETNSLVSVITVCKNADQTLQYTIDSVKSQNYLNLEYIVIDGLSQDNTVKIIKKNENFIKFWISEADLGLYDAMNKALTMCGGEWVIFMNSGDGFSENNILTKAMKSMSDADIIYSDTYLTNKGIPFKIQTANYEKGIFNHQSLIYRKSLHKIYGNYIVNRYITISDYIFFRDLKDIRVVKLDSPISYYEIGGLSSRSKSIYQKFFYDYLSGKLSYLSLINFLILYPAYRAIKNIIYDRR